MAISDWPESERPRERLLTRGAASLSDAELESKVRSCCEGILDSKTESKLIDTAWSVTRLKDAGALMEIINDVPPGKPLGV